MAKKVKNKTHKGLLKRVRITKSGKVKHARAFSGHLKSGKSPGKLRMLRKGGYASNPEAKRFEALLHRRLRGRTQPRRAASAAPAASE